MSWPCGEWPNQPDQVRPTLAQAEQKLLLPTHSGGLYARFGVDLSNGGVSPNPFLADAISGSLQFCRVTVTDPSAPTNADMRYLQPCDWNKFLAVADVKLLEGAALIIASFPTAQEWPDYTVQRTINSMNVVLKILLDQAKANYGYGVPVLQAGQARIGYVPHFPFYPYGYGMY